MLIIVEGADGTYKSTLVRRLADAITIATSPHGEVEVRHCGPPAANQHPLDAYVKPLYGYRPGTDQHVIYDRHYVGEWVYPGIFDRPSRADTATWRYVEMFLASRGALLVHANPADEVIRANVARRGDDLVTPDDAVRAARSFRVRINAQSQLPRLTYSDVDDPFLLAEIIANARDLELRASPLKPFVTYVGPPRPRYLLLGDVRHALRNRVGCEHVGDSTRYGSAFGPYPGTSGHFLLTHLSPLLFPEGRPVLGVANACDADDVAELRRALGYPNTVALGRNAHRALLDTITGPDDALFGGAPHPQWVRRFAHRHGWAYGVIVRDALETRANRLYWRPAGFTRRTAAPTTTDTVTEESAS